jgi:hypothetical protein
VDIVPVLVGVGLLAIQAAFVVALPDQTMSAEPDPMKERRGW